MTDDQKITTTQDILDAHYEETEEHLREWQEQEAAKNAWHKRYMEEADQLTEVQSRLDIAYEVISEKLGTIKEQADEIDRLREGYEKLWIRMKHND
tara:strand:+ start:39 stop:326 length:288 start_codon:yes stop_codon:yes gene_type:complete